LRRLSAESVRTRTFLFVYILISFQRPSGVIKMSDHVLPLLVLYWIVSPGNSQLTFSMPFSIL